MSRFVRGFVFMRFLSLSDLGIITLVGAIMGLFVMFQLGFLNGGYRIFSVNNPDRWKVNDLIYSYFFFLGVLFLLGIFIAFSLSRINVIELFYALPAILFGLLLVFNNWNRNILTAQQRFEEINRIEIYSTIISFTLLVSVFLLGIYGALIVIFSKELFFYVLTIAKNRNFLPRYFSLKFNEIKWVLSFGFLPYLAGVVATMNLQVETWSIAGFLSMEVLGEYYLPKLYIQLFLIVPVSISQLFFPESMQAFVKGNFSRVKKILSNYFLFNSLFCLFSVALTWLFIDVVIEFTIPKHIIGIKYIWLILPGLIFYVLLQPIDLIFNGAVKLLPFLWASGIALLITIITLPTLGYIGKLSLDYASIIKSISYFVTSAILFGIFITKRSSLWMVNKQMEKL
jgi:O-antigen/teichoic acid export membrane protein